MNKEKPATDASTLPKDAEARRRINIQQVQNVLLVWLDSNIDETNDDCQNTITKLRYAVNDIKTYTNVDQCLEFIQTVVDNKICLIISGSLGQHIVPRVHNLSQVDSVFIFCSSAKHHEQWAKDWPKIKGVFTDITPICEALKEAAHQCEQNAISMSFVGTNKKLDQLDPSFMYTQIIKEIILTIKFGQNHIQDYIDYCRDAFRGNKKEIKNIRQLEDEYHNKTPIYWYTCDMFLYPMLNRALRLMDGDIITRMGFFIGDLHRHIKQLHQEQYVGTPVADTFTVYRGQGLSTGDFEKMMKTKGGLISFNNFLSTSKDRNISLGFAQGAMTNPDQDIKQMGGNNRLYDVNLTLTADNDPELSRLTDYIRQETFPAEDIYQVLLDQTNDDEEKAFVYHLLGSIKDDQGKYEEALTFYEKSLAIHQKTLPSNHPDLASSYNDISLVYYNIGNYPKALLSHEKALEIQQESLPLNHPDLASSYYNIGLVYENMGNDSKARTFYEHAIQIGEQSLPSSHPDIELFRNNLKNVKNK
ncbi:unnamed protein product [Adineta steineri]|uniref:Tetratricopeptide repeat protein n=1 Tax=Adineta steineri TaxID=433720 RepID=A0A813V3T3_9BILA|nr:unnamed protein product [Adineta steineri]CAF1216882.1 unnamed protein product [Adineta steineri]